jgi:pyruvate kinase
MTYSTDSAYTCISLLLLLLQVGKPVLITRVVDTMAVSPRPTRAEATDVANAVLDGVDGILLGQETLRGFFPIESVQTLVSIARQAEKVSLIA